MRARPTEAVRKLLDVLYVALNNLLLLARLARKALGKRRGGSLRNLVIRHLREKLIVELAARVVRDDVVVAATVVNVVDGASQVAL